MWYWNVSRSLCHQLHKSLSKFVFQLQITIITRPKPTAWRINLSTVIKIIETRIIDCITPRLATKFGDRAIAVSCPLAWNSLPTSVRNCSSLSSFCFRNKSNLKAHLFNWLYIYCFGAVMIILFCFVRHPWIGSCVLWSHGNYRYNNNNNNNNNYYYYYY